MKYAWVENNKIRDTAISPSEQFTAEVAAFYNTEVTDEVDNGWELIDGIWTAPPQPVNTDTYLYVSYPELAQINIPIDLTVSVKFSDGSHAPVQSTYYVPVIRLADNKQAAFLSVMFTDGTASVSFTVAEPGIYSMSVDKIRPMPTATIVDHPEIIVTE